MSDVCAESLCFANAGHGDTHAGDSLDRFLTTNQVAAGGAPRRSNLMRAKMKAKKANSNPYATSSNASHSHPSQSTLSIDN